MKYTAASQVALLNAAAFVSLLPTFSQACGADLWAPQLGTLSNPGAISGSQCRYPRAAPCRAPRGPPQTPLGPPPLQLCRRRLHLRCRRRRHPAPIMGVLILTAWSLATECLSAALMGNFFACRLRAGSALQPPNRQTRNNATTGFPKLQ